MSSLFMVSTGYKSLNGRRFTETNETSGQNETDYTDYLFFGTGLISLRRRVKPWLEKLKDLY